ncbi:MAG: hypothetical protein IKV03_05030 [Alphaproteobacteria bacterium]|nr:hypothetical protein [Alphaproteobacteria bacterium]
MKKTVLSCAAILSLCIAAPAMADIDEPFMDWSYASGLDPKPRPQIQERQRNAGDLALAESTSDLEILDTNIYATSELGISNSQTNTFNNSEYTNSFHATTQNSQQERNSFTGMEQSTEAWSNGNIYGDNTQTSRQTTSSQYYQVPIQAIQTPAEIHRINNPVTVQYPVTKQYPISMQYPVTIQKEITVQKPVVVQQPIVVQRPIVMQQPVMVQHQPLMVQNKPLMVQQQPTVVQKQPIVVNAPAPHVVPTPSTHVVQRQVQTPCAMTAQQHVIQQPVVQTSRQPIPATPVIQIPVQVNGTLTGTFMPSTGCNGGCIK